MDEEKTAMPPPEVSAREAGLEYVSDDEPGIRRKRWGRGFTYIDPEGEHITDEEERSRLEALAIPPAWTDVWICPSPHGHLLATGRDDEGRKQYLYHPKWREVRQTMKFDRLIPFGRHLPQIRARCADDLARSELSRHKVLALVVRLLDQTLIRIGHPEYAEANASFGLASMRDRHVRFKDDGCTFVFSGKSGQEHEIALSDPELADLVQQCRDVPGNPLFQCYDDEGNRQAVDAAAVNAYLKETTGEAFTAKLFRTWGGTVTAAETLHALGPPADEDEANEHIREMIDHVADVLGNTPAVCRDYYIHPALLEAYREGTFTEQWTTCQETDPLPQFDPTERALLCFLEARSSS